MRISIIIKLEGSPSSYRGAVSKYNKHIRGLYPHRHTYYAILAFLVIKLTIKRLNYRWKFDLAILGNPRRHGPTCGRFWPNSVRLEACCWARGRERSVAALMAFQPILWQVWGAGVHPCLLGWSAAAEVMGMLWRCMLGSFVAGFHMRWRTNRNTRCSVHIGYIYGGEEAVDGLFVLLRPLKSRFQEHGILWVGWASSLNFMFFIAACHVVWGIYIYIYGFANFCEVLKECIWPTVQCLIDFIHLHEFRT